MKKNDIPSYMRKEVNHKVDTNPERTHLVNRAKKYNMKHAGSKTMKQLKRYFS